MADEQQRIHEQPVAPIAPTPPLTPAAPPPAPLRYEDSILAWHFRGVQELLQFLAGTKHGISCIEVRTEAVRVFCNSGETMPLVQGFTLTRT